MPPIGDHISSARNQPLRLIGTHRRNLEDFESFSEKTVWDESKNLDDGSRFDAFNYR